MESVKGKVALVTGAARGIGYGIAHILVQNGAKVCLTDVDDKEGIRATQLLRDEYDAFVTTKKTFGALDIVCNNAGIGHEGQWRKCIDINFAAMVHGTMLAAEHMGTDSGGKGGQIVNMGSITGIVDRLPPMPVYCATKHAIVAYTRSMAANPWLTDKGLRINCMCPSFVDTALIKVYDESQVYGGQPAIDQLIELLGQPMPTLKVAEEFLKVVQDITLNGAAVIVQASGTEISFAK